MSQFNGIFLQYWAVALIGALLLAIAGGFFIRFVRPAWRLGQNLTTSMTALRSIRERAAGPVVELDQIANEAMTDPRLAQLWSEYAKTLHPQLRVDEAGQNRIVRWRATALAESFFTEQAIVDNPLKTEFYKHLPGILTGLGIIGTFTGLIRGLINFDVSLDPTQAQGQLAALVNSVGHAFFVSAAAITLAMFFTWIEKSLVTLRYKQVEQLRQQIDSLFEAGAGEEYLERLMVASETSATQASQIKDALVADLKEILTELTAQQMEAQSRQAGQISSDLGKAIAEHMGGPLADIAASVMGVKENQGEAVNRMLTDVLKSFSDQMHDMFGGQMRGMADLLKETSQAMSTTASQFAQLASSMDTAGKGAIEAMGERLNHAITSMEARQQIMNKQMGEFVEQIRVQVADSQSETGHKLQETLTALGQQVSGIVGELRRQSDEASASHGRRQEQLEQNTSNLIGSLSAQMENLLKQSVETNRSLQETVARLSSATDSAMASMSTGAETLFVAASEFAKAGQGVADTMRASSEAIIIINGASEKLNVAADSIKAILSDYGRTRDAFQIMVTDLKSTVENARREASMTSEIIGRIEAATTQLGIAEKESEEYLKGVSDVLTKSHESFSENIVRTLREGNSQFHKELTTAVGLLSGAVKDLGDTLDELPNNR